VVAATVVVNDLKDAAQAEAALISPAQVAADTAVVTANTTAASAAAAVQEQAAASTVVATAAANLNALSPGTVPAP
jgi:hypothetical protein